MVATAPRRLSIVVPYRDREQHLRQFIPHLRAYFACDKLDWQIPYRVLVVEQEEGQPFNRGALNNAGFLLTRDESDYVCFHDVDYLPIWADYSWSDVAGPIIWYGAEHRPIALGRSQLFTTHAPEDLFGGATLFPNAVFEQVNGFANGYWGWGWEDMDLKARMEAAGLPLMHRKGTFKALYHDNAGFEVDGKPSSASLRNQQIYERRWAPGAPAVEDGLSTLKFELLARAPINRTPGPDRDATWEIVRVRLHDTI